MTETPEPPPAAPPPPPQAPPPVAPPEAAPTEASASAAPPAAAASQIPLRPILIGVGVAIALLAAFFVWRTQFSGPSEETYAVQPYTPPTELISARERVPGRAAPDDSSEVLVEFGQGVTLNVTGRVSRGLGNDWYAVGWNDTTAFIRQSDAVTGSGAPPGLPERVQPEEEEEVVKPDEEEIKPDEEEEVATVEEPAPTWGLEISDVQWVREPSSRDFARYFPRRALDEGQSGNVTLDCVIGGNGRLNCSVASESPSGYGFGEAALNIARQTRVRTQLRDGNSASGRHLRLPLSFRAG